MSTNKILVAGLIGGIVQFFAGWLIYGMLLHNMMAPASDAVRAVAKEPMELWAMGLSCLLWGVLLAWIFGKWAGISSLNGGAQAGALIGLLSAASYDLGMYSMMNLSTTTQMCLDVVAATAMGAIVGGAIGWWYGRDSNA